MQTYRTRPDWDEYFMMIAKLVAMRSTCLATPVGAVIVKDRQILASGYNGPPSSSPHCIDQGFCYPGLDNCAESKTLPSRAIHAEANAIAQAAKHGISTQGSQIYVTLEPCLSCLKLIISAGIKEVFFETEFNGGSNLTVRDSFVDNGLIVFKRVCAPYAIAQQYVSLFTKKRLNVNWGNFYWKHYGNGYLRDKHSCVCLISHYFGVDSDRALDLYADFELWRDEMEGN
jgi:dCMP deaminase